MDDCSKTWSKEPTIKALVILGHERNWIDSIIWRYIHSKKIHDEIPTRENTGFGTGVVQLGGNIGRIILEVSTFHVIFKI